MKQNPILSIGLKGKTAEVNRMKELMGNMNINENTSRSIIELVKVGPDGNSYAIVRENHEYFIKSANKSKNVLAGLNKNSTGDYLRQLTFYNLLLNNYF